MSKRATRASAYIGLRARWALLLLFGLLVIIAGRGLLTVGWPAAAADSWALLATCVLVAQLAGLWFDLPRNFSGKKGKLLPGFGPGTWLSLLRMLALSLMAGFLWPPRPAGWLAWLPFWLYLFFNLADLADGYAARACGMITRLGEKLDLALDGRGVLAATLLAYHYGAVGWWFVVVGLARYLFVLAAWVQSRLGRTFELQVNPLRRPLAGAQMGIGVALLAPQLPNAVTFFVATFSMFPFVGNFVFDWLAAAGWLRFKKGAQPGGAWLALSDWGSVFARVALAAFLTWRVLGAQAGVYVVLDVILGLVLLFGLAGRTAAFALLVETGFRLQNEPVQARDFAILFVCLILLYLGTGTFSLRPLKEGGIFQHWGIRRRA
ncbi:MAG TPA: CDP-alcohol phosphatidyltransferase family protein [Anaerolineales bacterium]|nr:CDP-alcohol phosphatidyltransferase family protein [Anaerolineales bacterium]